MKMRSRHAVVLAGSLSQNTDERNTCEKSLKDLQSEGDYPVKICQVVLDTNELPAVRQLGSVVLKRFVQSHWLSASDKFEPPEIAESVKAKLREMLPFGLKEPVAAIRTGVASVIGTVAHYDWPESWPQLFPILSEAVKSEDVNLVAGAIKVLVEFSADLSDQQVAQLGPLLLEELLRIFLADQVYSSTIRTQAIEICNTIVSTICFMSEVDRKSTQKLMKPVLPRMTEAFVQSLTLATSDMILKTEVLKLLSLLMEKFPKLLASFLPQISDAIFVLFKQSLTEYISIIDSGCGKDESYLDYDGKQFTCDQLIISLFEVIQVLVENEHLVDTLLNTATKEELIFLALHYMQITAENIIDWHERVEQYCEDEDGEAANASVRSSALDLILALSDQDSRQDQTTIVICKAVARVITEGNELRAAGNPNWWKLHETAFLAMGSIADSLVDFEQPDQLPFQLVEFIDSVLMPDLRDSGVDFLQGQGLWFTSRLAKRLPLSVISQLLEVCSTGISQCQSSVLQVLSLKAISGFAEYLQNKEANNTVDPYAKNIILSTIKFATQYGENIMYMALTCLAHIIKLCPNAAAVCEARIVPLSIACLLKYNGDPLIPRVVCELIQLMGAIPHCRETVEKRLVPSVLSIIAGDPKRLPLRLPSAAIEVLEALIRSGVTPLSEAVLLVFPALVQGILSTDDPATLAAGRECIRAYLSVAANQLFEWKDAEGNNGISYVFRVINYLLSPSAPEMAAGMIAQLISVVLKRVGANVAPHLEAILTAVLLRYQTSDTATVKQSLIMVFAHLIHYCLPDLLLFLKSREGPAGYPTALHYVMCEWCERQQQFIGSYDRQVSTLAICKLLEFAVSSNDAALLSISVKDESMTVPSSVLVSPGVKTRSKAPRCGVAMITEIPLLAKLYKLLILELGDIIENQTAAADIDETLDDDDDEESDDESEGDQPDVNANVSSKEASLQAVITGLAGDVLSEGSVDEDPDASEDPLSKIDLKEHLCTFLHQLTQLPQYPTFEGYATPSEKNLLKIAGISQ